MKTIREKAGYTVRDLGLVGFDRAYTLQKQYVHNVSQGGTQTLLLCEHPPVLTLGRLADENHMLIPKEGLIKQGVDVYHIDRGGDITLHAPGQLVVYPILDLTNFGKDLRSYLNQLEQVAIDLLGGFDIVASRSPGQTGVWVEKQKITSIGIGVHKWIAFHGLAVNVSTDLSLFAMIKPCGLDVEMTSISKVKGKTIEMAEVKEKLIDCFSTGFQFNPMRS